MPRLDWIGKKAVVNHHREVPFHLLRENPELSVGDSDSGNLLVQGDNLLALKALLPYYAGQVKCIYIDPPYNTGNEGWVYNDNVNSPEMREWLGRAVGKEAEDLSRHDKWLCMMYPRLALLREFLRDDGAIFISIDDNEVHFLRMMMDEIFGANNFCGDVIWQHSIQAKGYSGTLSLHHNHTLIYGGPRFALANLERTEEHNVNYSNPDNDPRGLWRSGDVRNALVRRNLMYDITSPSGKTIKHPPKGWRFSQETFERELAEGKIIFSKDETRIIRKIYLADQDGRVPESIWFASEAGTTREASAEIEKIFGSKGSFDTPKPTRLIQRILQIATSKDSLVIDSFAGSGTTGHAVLAQNAADGGIRRFILVEMDDNICRNITAQRLSRVSRGYNDVPPLGGGFRFCELSEPLFDERGNIRATVSFADLARHVFFTETGAPLPTASTPDSPLLGVHNSTAVYLLYNGILKDKTIKGGNVLTTAVLSLLPGHAGPKVIYGTACRIDDERLRREEIVFKQLPYKLKISV